jgi:predicted amidophosphoribosyltransferase
VRRAGVPWLLWLVDLVFPQRCASCGRGVHGSPVLCDACTAALRPVPAPLCARCGAPVAWPVPRCRDCAGRRIAFVSARSAFLYTPTLRGLVRSWKERGVRGAGQLAADLVCGVLEPPAVDAIAAVPADPGRLLVRGHDPPGRLAAALAVRWELPLVVALERTRSVPRQTSLPGAERRRNLQGVFRPAGTAPRRVLLVDDVYTTGSTANAAASALRRGGASTVDVVTFARVIR